MEPKEAAWERSRVVALTDVDADQAAIVAAAARAVGMTEVPAFAMRPVEEQDWVRLTQSQFAPIHIGKNIWVVPSWHEAPDPDGLILELDPGLAFGTGSHPTTRLCMEWLEANPAPGKTVLDYGCGSGILAMVAKKLGAQTASISTRRRSNRRATMPNATSARSNISCQTRLPLRHTPRPGLTSSLPTSCRAH
jgi:ribosomal protein L11 methyltransferase